MRVDRLCALSIIILSLVSALPATAQSEPASVLIFPHDGSVQINPLVTFVWNPAQGATSYGLLIGETPGSSTAFQIKTIASYQTVQLHPATKYYLQLQTFYGDISVSTNASFVTTATPALLLSPSDGATQVAPTVNFSWISVANAQSYMLQIGSAVGATDIFSSGAMSTAQLQYTLPKAGKYYVRLWTNFYGSWYYSDSSFSSGTFSVLTYPSDDSISVDPNVTFRWTAVAAAQSYYLYVGDTWRSYDVVNSGETQDTSLQVRLARGKRYYATVFTEISGMWIPFDISFVTDTGTAQMIYPLDKAAAISTGSVFAWSAIQDATSYQMNVGTGPGLSDVFASGVVQKNTARVPGLLSQTKYYIRLMTFKPGIAQFLDSSFTTGATGTGIAEMVYPPDGAANVDVTQPFTWTGVSDAEKYYLHVGTAPWLGDIFDSSEIDSTSVNIPQGSFSSGKYYLFVSTRKAGVWYSAQTTFTVGNRAGIVTPADNATDVDPLAPITWTTFPGAQAYYLYVGTSEGARDVYQSYETLDTQRYIPNLVPGVKYYLRLFTHSNEGWLYGDTSFYAGSGLARLIQPANGNANVDRTAPFVWNSLPDAQAYYLTIGSSPGARDIYDNGQTTNTVAFVPGLAVGLTYYVRLYTEKRSVWRFVDSAFQIGTSPPTGNNTSSTKFENPLDLDAAFDPFTAFTWDPAPNTTSYELLVGSSPGAWDIFDSGEITATSVTASGLGYGKGYFARLWLNQNGKWSYTDISFQTEPLSMVANLAQLESNYYGQVKQATSSVRLMADATNIPIPNTPLAAYVGSFGGKYANCSQFAIVLVSQLQKVGIASRLRGMTLTGTSFESHTLVEYYDPFNDKWSATDPTFGLFYFNSVIGAGQSPDELSSLVNSGQFKSIYPQYLTSYGNFFTSTYYLDPITLFANIFAPGPKPQFGPQPNAADPFVTTQDLNSSSGASGTYVAKFKGAADNIVLQNGTQQITLFPKDGTDWSAATTLNSGWTVTSFTSGAQLFTFKRIIF